MYPLFFVVIMSVSGYLALDYLQSREKVHVVTYRNKNGWGYKIKVLDRYIINQPFIPVIQGEKQFPDRRTAKRAGNIVKKRLLNNQPPGLTMEDIEKLGIDSLGNAR